MCGVGAPGAISDGPNTFGGRLQTLVHLHIAAVGRRHSRLFETNAVSIWRASSGGQQVRAFQRKFASAARAKEPDPLAGVALDAGYFFAFVATVMPSSRHISSSPCETSSSS